jgi:hypothetical protein
MTQTQSQVVISNKQTREEKFIDTLKADLKIAKSKIYKYKTLLESTLKTMKSKEEKFTKEQT